MIRYGSCNAAGSFLVTSTALLIGQGLPPRSGPFALTNPHASTSRGESVGRRCLGRHGLRRGTKDGRSCRALQKQALEVGRGGFNGACTQLQYVAREQHKIRNPHRAFSKSCLTRVFDLWHLCSTDQTLVGRQIRKKNTSTPTFRSQANAIDGKIDRLQPHLHGSPDFRLPNVYIHVQRTAKKEFDAVSVSFGRLIDPT